MWLFGSTSRRGEPCHFSTSPFSSIQVLRDQADRQPGSHWSGDVRSWGYAAEARQTSSPDRKLSIRICVRVRHGPRSISLGVLTLRFLQELTSADRCCKSPLH